MNVLFTSAGRRGYLLDYFREALNGEGEVHACSNSAATPAFLHADRSVVSPSIVSNDYIEFLLAYCRVHSIGAIVPLFDIDVEVLSRHREKFSSMGISVVVSSARVSRICNDKWFSFLFLAGGGFYTPMCCKTPAQARQAVVKGRLAFPLMVKPRWGMGSIGVEVAENEKELDAAYGKTLRAIETTYLRDAAADGRDASVVIQQMVEGNEYGLDVVNDLSGNHVTTFVKRKLAMRSGETDSAVTVNDSTLTALGRALGVSLGHVGNLDVDMIRSRDGPCILEMNARFGGGYPFSHLAGADLPRTVVAWLTGSAVDPAWLGMREGILSVKDLSVRTLQVNSTVTDHETQSGEPSN